MENNWKWFTLTPSSTLFPPLMAKIKEAKFGTPSIIIKAVDRNKTSLRKKEYVDYYKIIFDWQDENTSGIEIYKLIGENLCKEN